MQLEPSGGRAIAAPIDLLAAPRAPATPKPASAPAASVPAEAGATAADPAPDFAEAVDALLPSPASEAAVPLPATAADGGLPVPVPLATPKGTKVVAPKPAPEAAALETTVAISEQTVPIIASAPDQNVPIEASSEPETTAPPETTVQPLDVPVAAPVQALVAPVIAAAPLRTDTASAPPEAGSALPPSGAIKRANPVDGKGEYAALPTVSADSELLADVPSLKPVSLRPAGDLATDKTDPAKTSVSVKHTETAVSSATSIAAPDRVAVVAPTAAPPPAPSNSAPIDTRQPHFPQAVALAVAHRARAGEDSFLIRLDPADMGPIRIELSFAADGSVAGVIQCESKSTQDLLRGHLDQFARAMQDQGMRADSGAFRFGSDGYSTGGGGSQRQSGQHAAARGWGQTTSAFAESADYQPVTAAAGRINLFA